MIKVLIERNRAGIISAQHKSIRSNQLRRASLGMYLEITLRYLQEVFTKSLLHSKMNKILQPARLKHSHGT